MTTRISPRHLLLLIGGLGLTLLAGCGPGQLGNAKLLGSWKAVTVKMEVNDTELKLARNIELVFANQQDVTFITDGEVHRGTCELDTTVEPRRIHFKPADGNLTDKSLYGIFVVDAEEQLILCVSQRRYPPAFAARPGYDYVLITFKRQDVTVKR